MNREKIKEIFLRNGFTIKEGYTDLKEYVYRAAEDLIREYTAPTGDDRLFCDLTTAKEKAEFVRSGRAHETGIIAKSMEQEVARAFDALDEVENGRK